MPVEIYQVAEHHREITALARSLDQGGDRRRWRRSGDRRFAALVGGPELRLRFDCRFRFRRGSTSKLADGREHYPPMPKQDADFLFSRQESACEPARSRS